MRHCALKRWHRRRQLGRLGAPCLRTLNPGSLHGKIRGTRTLHVNIQGAAYTEGAECRTRRSNRSVSTQKQPKRAEQRRAGYQQCTWVYFVPRVATRGETVSSTPDLIPTSGEQPALASTGPPPSGKMSRHLGIAMPSCVAEPSSGFNEGHLLLPSGGACAFGLSASSPSSRSSGAP